MTSEEIIQRLLDEKKITVAEAMIILKDLAKIGINYVLGKEQQIIPAPPTVVMYGVTTSPTTWADNTIATSKYPHPEDDPQS